MTSDYFRIRDYEYVQPLYDLAFFLEVDALARSLPVPKYRTFSLWRAAYSLDGYGTTIDRWLDQTASVDDLDYVPSLRIREYLRNVRRTGSLPELRPYRGERFARCVRLRAVRGLGPSKIALSLLPHFLDDGWLDQVASGVSVSRERLAQLCHGGLRGPWQSAHVVPPALRFLHRVEEVLGRSVDWQVRGIDDPFHAVTGPLNIAPSTDWQSLVPAFHRALKRERLFRLAPDGAAEGVRLEHQMGWQLNVQPGSPECVAARSIPELAGALDPLAHTSVQELQCDLHLHTAWSDGSASVSTMARAIAASGLKYFAVTDHSRTLKLQGGLTPPLWLREANAITLAAPVCPVLHGIEVDILRDGTLDLPASLLAAADLVIGSVHSSWTSDGRGDTDRLIRAIESGSIDVIAHPTSAITGKPGVPDYLRPPADVHWDEVFATCARWRVAVELNCFPSRLDLPLLLLQEAADAGCAISIGSDAHARSHLLNLRFGDAALRRLRAPTVLNRLSYDELGRWILDSRAARRCLTRRLTGYMQTELQFDAGPRTSTPALEARIEPPRQIPSGGTVVGIDLTAGNKATGVAVLVGLSVETCSVLSDEDILEFVRSHNPAIVSIDSPLGLPGGGGAVDPTAGIVRVAEHDLASVGIPAYPALIDSMRNLTLRGIRLRRALEESSQPPRVIESYPGAAQDILCIPRKQRSLELLREGLRRLGLRGPGLETHSHDEMDAITAAVVGRYFDCGAFEPMGIPSEAQLIVPRLSPLAFENPPVICLAGKTGAGKSVAARYLSLFYGFTWIRTREVVRQLLIEDGAVESGKRLFGRTVDATAVTERDLREFGAVLLDVHGQRPLRRLLSRTVSGAEGAVVVDSIRDGSDIDRGAIGGRPVIVWLIECSDETIRQRLAKRSKLGEKRHASPSPVDHNVGAIRNEADLVIDNSGSLEDLRWALDDGLFSTMRLRA